MKRKPIQGFTRANSGHKEINEAPKIPVAIEDKNRIEYMGGIVYIG